MQFLNSSTVESGSYDEDTGELTVTFKRGARYRYSGVPADVAAAFFDAPSPGRFIHEVLPAYSYVRA